MGGVESRTTTRVPIKPMFQTAFDVALGRLCSDSIDDHAV